MANIYKKKFPKSTCSLNSTAEFIDHLRNINCKNKNLLVSFDIVNLYPSIVMNEMQVIANLAIREKYGENYIENHSIQ